MKKSKFKLDGATIQKLLVLHCEKIVLVVVLGIMAWLVYMGYALPGLEADKTPVALAQKSDSTKKFIDDPTRWTNVVSQERFIPMDLAQQAGDSQIATDPSFYQVTMPWKTENFTKQTPRTDPRLLPPEHLIVHTVIGPLFSVFTDEELASEVAVDPTYPPESTDAAKPKRRPPPKRPRGGMDMVSGYPGSETAESPMPRGGGARRGSRRSSSNSTDTSSSSYPSGSMDMAEGAGMSGDYPGMGGFGGAQGKVNPESILGFQGSAQGIQRHVVANVLTAVVPFERQVEEFAAALQSSLDYEWQRDQPVYLGFRVERAEVPTSDLAADPSTLDWKPINVRATRIEQLGDPTPPGRWGQWAGVLPEVSDPTYLDPSLTHPAPPFMQRNVWPLLTHPDVPLAPLASTVYDPGMRPKTGSPTDANQTPVEDVPGLPGPSGGFPGSGYPGGNRYGGASEGESYGSGMPGMPGMGMPGGMGMSGSMGMYSGMSSGMSGTSMPGSMGMSGMGSSGYGGSYGYGDGMSTMAIAPPKYKLVRFTDTHVEQGKHYRYRLKVLLNDPNHPYYTQPPPPLASLAPEVQTRIKALDAEDAKKNTPDASTKNDPTKPPFRTYWRESETWSQPSDVVSIPSPSSFFAGGVTQPAGAEIVAGKPRLPNTPPQVKVLVSVWDPAKVVDVPAEETAFRGSTLNFVKDAKAIHPIDHVVVDYKEYKFQTGGILADLMGGEPIPKKNKGSTAPALEAPGEILVFDVEGNLRVRNETDDIEEFRRALVPEPDPKSLPGAAGSDLYSSGDAAELSGGSGYPGSSGYPGRGRSPRGSGGRSMPGGP